MDNLSFEDTRPYTDQEIPAAMARIASSPYFQTIVKYLFPDIDFESYKKEFLKISTVNEFQVKVMNQFIGSIIKNTSSSFHFSGLESLSDEKKCMFISNHRDITLDAALLQLALHESGMDTSEITFGSNLMKEPIAVDLGKSNKMFKIVRGGNIYDFYNNSMKVSSYMRYAITQKSQSTWIAQRNGRTKDGDDKTEIAVLKMFSMSSDKKFVENMLELNITPMIISYEYEPCDFLKALELYVSRYQKYVKSANEDMSSILKGVTQWKGEINLVVSKSITREELEECDRCEKNGKFQMLAHIIDDRIYSNYKLYKTNYIAYDILHDTKIFCNYYTAQEQEAFVEYMRNGLKDFQGDQDELRSIFLGIYANSVKNVLKE